MTESEYSGMFYDAIRYRFMKHIAFGKRKEHYKEKYHAIKELIEKAEKQHVFIFGIHFITILNMERYSCWKIANFPVVIIYHFSNKKTIRIFGIQVYKIKNINIELHNFDEKDTLTEPILKNYEDLSSNGKTILALLSAMECMEGK